MIGSLIASSNILEGLNYNLPYVKTLSKRSVKVYFFQNQPYIDITLVVAGVVPLKQMDVMAQAKTQKKFC